MRFKTDLDQKRVEFADWLLSLCDREPNDWRLKHWKGSRRRVGSPLNWYFGEIERFSFDLGVQFSIPEAEPEEPRYNLLQQVVKSNKLTDLMPFAFERGAVTGSVLMVFRPHEDRFYEILSYERGEYMPLEDGGWAIQYKGDDGYWTRFAVTPTAYEYYDRTKFPASQWRLTKSITHSYAEVPAIEIAHKFSGHRPEPTPGFDWISLELSAEIVSQTLASAAAFNYLGAPWVVGPDPEQLREELAQRSQVLSGSTSTEFQDTAILGAGGMPPHHAEFMDKLSQAFADHMRVNWVPSKPPGDTSSLTLRLLYSKTIKAADRVAETYLGGVSKLLECILKAAAIDGVLADVTPTDPGSHRVRFDYEEELFAPTPAEKASLLGVVQSLIELGIRPQVALQEYYGSRTEEEIDELLYGA